ncbi:MAG TPA: hypothetical protein DC053_03845 [Lachnoclostridium sp.]|nr:hypothetical protein [Lachnoclostridium sp.]
MNAAEMRNENEYYRMLAAEREKAEIAVNKVKDIIENDKQRYSDIVMTHPDDSVRLVAQNKWKALDDLQKELDQMKI